MINEEKILRCIAERESNNRYWVPGAAGERSVYQISHVVWIRYSSMPFEKASTKEGQVEAHRVAMAHLNHLIAFLRQNQVVVNVFYLALLWNAGETKWLNNSMSMKNYRYALEVEQIFDGLHESQ